MDTTIFQLITSDTAISTMVDDRVYPLKRNQGDELPAITYRRVSSVREYSDDGMVKLFDQSYDLHLYTESYSDLQNLTDAIEDLSGKSGIYGGYKIRYVMIRETGDDDIIDQSDQLIYTQQMEIKITLEKI